MESVGLVEQSVTENGDIDSVPPMDPNHNAAAAGFLAMESVGLVEQAVTENGDIDSVPPMDPNHNAAAAGFLAMESVAWSSSR